MKKFWHNTRENKTIQEELTAQLRKLTDLQQKPMTQLQKNMNCEETIIKDKQRFGRVRSSTMQLLREQYGITTADRALWRVSARKSRGYFQKNSTF